MEMTEREKEIIVWALHSYYDHIINLIVSKEKYGKKEQGLRDLKTEIAGLLEKLDGWS